MVLLLSATPAIATPITWKVSPVGGPASLTGTFKFDTSTKDYSDIDLQIAGGGVFSGKTFSVEPANFSGGPYLAALETGTDPNDAAGKAYVLLMFNFFLPDVQTHLLLFNAAAAFCANADCSRPAAPTLQLGGMVDQVPAVSAPEPLSMSFLVAGLAGLNHMRRRIARKNRRMG
jgi:hypothetical protein